MTNPRSVVTSSFGILIIVCALTQFVYYLFDGDPTTKPDMRLILEVIAGVAFLFAKDRTATHTGIMKEEIMNEVRNIVNVPQQKEKDKEIK